MDNYTDMLNELDAFEIDLYDKVNQNLNLMYVFSQLNKEYGKSAICQKISEWYTEIQLEKSVDERLIKINSIKDYLEMIIERLGEDKEFYMTMLEIKKRKFFSKLFYRRKLDSVLEVISIINDVTVNNDNIKSDLINRQKQNNENQQAADETIN